MVIFELDNYKITMDKWAKHYREIGLHFKRVYEDGKVVETRDELLLDVVRNNKNNIIKKNVKLFDEKTREYKKAIDYLVLLKNKEYKYPIKIKSNNILKNTLKARYHFMYNDYNIILDGGIHSDNKPNPEEIRKNIVLLAEKEVPFCEKGIMMLNDDEVYVIALDIDKTPLELKMKLDKLVDSLDKIEVYEVVDRKWKI